MADYRHSHMETQEEMVKIACHLFNETTDPTFQNEFILYEEIM